MIKVRFEQVDFAVAVMFALGHGLLDEVAGADVDEDVLGVVESGGDVEGGGGWERRSLLSMTSAGFVNLLIFFLFLEELNQFVVVINRERNKKLPIV